jgi:predicted TIM-barrel enzyme/DNA-binding NtrC family response regulator
MSGVRTAEVHARLRRAQPSSLARGRFLLGAAVGTGMAAKAAERGGADFLLAASAGRLRSMGVSSVACMLALRNSNRLVMEFGQSEILCRTLLPVFFGATTFGLGSADELLDEIAASGFHGVANFPTSIFWDGRYREFLEECGEGFAREVSLLHAARLRGLSTLAYVQTLEEARRVAADADIVTLNLGWNTGGTVGVDSALDLDAASSLASSFVQAVRSVNQESICLFEGGPIVTPEQMDQVCKVAKADGYIGGSPIDRVPLETAVEMATGAFKTIGDLRKQVNVLERRLHRDGTITALIGFSESMERAREQVARAMETDLPVLIVGEPGTGRREIAKLIHEARAHRGRWLVAAQCKAGGKEDTEVSLFGCAAGAVPGVAKPRTGLLELAHGSTLLLDDVGTMDAAVQRQLLQAVSAGGFWPRGGTEIIPLNTRFIGITCFDPSLEPARFDASFVQWLSTVRIDLPPFRDHLEDLPMLAESIARTRASSTSSRVSPCAHRALLGHQWLGNLAELRSVLQAAALRARDGMITEAHLAELRSLQHTQSRGRSSFPSERDWILDGLSRNRYRRAETARFLRLSRKTLYNKMQQYRLLEREEPAAMNAPRRGRSRPLRQGH